MHLAHAVPADLTTGGDLDAVRGRTGVEAEGDVIIHLHHQVIRFIRAVVRLPRRLIRPVGICQQLAQHRAGYGGNGAVGLGHGHSVCLIGQRRHILIVGQGQIRLLVPRPLGVGQEAHRHRDAHQHRRHRDPEAGLFIPQHRLYPGLDPHLAKGERTGGHPAAAPAAIQQRLGIGGPFLRRHVPDHPLIAGQLHIPAEQDIRHPHQRIIPVHRQQRKAQGLPHMIPPPQVGPLVPQHAVPGRLVHAGGQIDTGPEHTQDEGRLDVVAQVHIALQRDGRRHRAPQAQIACQRRHHDDIDTHRPRDGQQVHVNGAGRRRGLHHRIRGNLRRRIIHRTWRNCGSRHAGQQRGGPVADIAAETRILEIRHLPVGVNGVARQPVDR